MAIISLALSAAFGGAVSYFTQKFLASRAVAAVEAKAASDVAAAKAELAALKAKV